MIGFRKLFGFLVSMTLLMVVFSICVLCVPESVTPVVIIGFLTGFLTDTFAFIGGNVWSKWIDFQKNKGSVAMSGTRFTGKSPKPKDWGGSYEKGVWRLFNEALEKDPIQGKGFDTMVQDDVKPVDSIEGVIDKLKREYERLDSEAKKKVEDLLAGRTVDGIKMKDSVIEIPDEEEVQRGLMRAASGNEGSDLAAFGEYTFPRETGGGVS